MKKAAAILPRPFNLLAKAAEQISPDRFFLRIYLGDVKLFVCRKVIDFPGKSDINTVAEIGNSYVTRSTYSS